MKTVLEISEYLGCTVLNRNGDFYVSDVVGNSSECGPGVIFAALRGERFDGHDFARDAYERGSRAFILEHTVDLPSDAVLLIVEDSRAALARASLFVYGSPEEKLKLIGVTGTKGKSTVVFMTRKILDRAGYKVASISTMGYTLGGVTLPTDNTTPESCKIARFLADAADSGATHAVIEVSSQGIKQRRVDGLNFSVCVMTNISRDHIGAGEHTSFSDYKKCKLSLFSRCETGIFNADDRYYDEFSSECGGISYGITNQADITASDIKNIRTPDAFGISFDVFSGDEKQRFFVPMPGKASVYDALAAIGAAKLLGVSLSLCAEALSDVTVPGRFEKVPNERGIDAVIDYSHNGASLRQALISARSFTEGRVICVFGSVGGRTKMRRAALGRAADKYADVCILTSDDPNFENPLDILSDIADNITDKPYYAIPDREEAICFACEIARDNDFLIVCGKGHEKYQLIRGQKIPLNEKEILKSNLKLKVKI